MPRMIEAILSDPLARDARDHRNGPIESITPMPYTGMGLPLSTTRPIVAVLVEARVLDELPGSTLSVSDLDERLRHFHDDLTRDGFDARTVAVRMQHGQGHGDGEGVLALRKLFQDLHTSHPNFAGAILVGSFPEAMLVRRWIWKKTDQTIAIGGTQHTHVDLLQIDPEVIAERTDLVLADLDGNWDLLYRRDPTALDSIKAIPDQAVGTWPVDGGLFTSSVFHRTTRTFEDFFWIRDDDVDELPASGTQTLILRLWTTPRHPECTAADRARPNVLARPEIAVSRINARNVAVMPDPAFTDTTGAGFLDATGTPQPVQTATPLGDIWTQDAAFERRLLIDFLDRNHRFRRGDHYFTPLRTAAIASAAFGSGWGSASGLAASLGKASSSFAPSVVVQDATVLEFVVWMKQSALFRGFATHANHKLTQFDPVDYQDGVLDAEVGGTPWRWRLTASGPGSSLTYTPSLDQQGANADLRLYRSMWENGTLASTSPCFLLHNGCHVNSPAGARGEAYDSVNYARFQEAESMMFHLNGLAIVSRAKEMNDWISRDFPGAFGAADGRFADGLTAYFTADAGDANLAKETTIAKRTYWWSVLGDWTLRLRYAPVPLAKFRKPLAAVRPLLRDGWMITDGFGIVKIVPEEDLARRIVDVIDRRGLTERYVVGDEKGGWEYWFVDGAPPRADESSELPEESIDIDVRRLVVDHQRGTWTVGDGREVVARAATRLDAETIVAVLQHHEAAAIHWIGERHRPSITYFTTRRPELPEPRGVSREG